MSSIFKFYFCIEANIAKHNNLIYVLQYIHREQHCLLPAKDNLHKQVVILTRSKLQCVYAVGACSKVALLSTLNV